mgnify:CR=1 FL=1
MKIIAVHKGFACDHSSTSYEFLAVDKPLSQKARRDVSSLSSRAAGTAIVPVAWAISTCPGTDECSMSQVRSSVP